MWCPRAPGRPRACSKNNISMINVFILKNINIKTSGSQLSKILISEVCIKLLDLRINRYTRSSSQFQKGCWPLPYTIHHVSALTRNELLMLTFTVVIGMQLEIKLQNFYHVVFVHFQSPELFDKTKASIKQHFACQKSAALCRRSMTPWT